MKRGALYLAIGFAVSAWILCACVVELSTAASEWIEARVRTLEIKASGLD